MTVFPIIFWLHAIVIWVVAGFGYSDTFVSKSVESAGRGMPCAVTLSHTCE